MMGVREEGRGNRWEQIGREEKGDHEARMIGMR
jgi:hypothetical protein